MSTTLRGFAGDWHGNKNWALGALDRFKSQDVTVIYHVGDFGVWPGPSGKEFLYKVDARLRENDQTLYVVLGNHEDYNQVDKFQVGADGWLEHVFYPRIRFAPRGHVWVDGGARFAALGGAGSVDRNVRVEGVSWWPQEAVTRADVDTLVSNVTAHGWDRVDVLLTHEAPAGLHRPGGKLPAWFTPEVAHDCWQQRVLLREACDLVRPHSLVHGHWHTWFEDTLDGTGVDGGEYVTTVWGLPNEGHADNCVTAEPVRGVGLADVETAWF